jgi:hypothetical protein
LLHAGIKLAWGEIVSNLKFEDGRGHNPVAEAKAIVGSIAVLCNMMFAPGIKEVCFTEVDWLKTRQPSNCD